MAAVDTATRPYVYAAYEASGGAVVGHLAPRCRALVGAPLVVDDGWDAWPCAACVSLDQLDAWARRSPLAVAKLGVARSRGTAAAEILQNFSPGTKPEASVSRYTGCKATDTSTQEDTTMQTLNRSNDLTAEILEGLKNAFATAARYGVSGVEDMRRATLKCYRLGDLTAAMALDITDAYVAAAAVKAQVAADQSSACLNCGNYHAAHSGSPCHVSPAPKADPKPTGPAFQKGMIITNAAGQIVRVYVSKQGNLYGKVRDDYGTWEYSKGAMVGARHLTADEARQIGLTTERCVFCATPIETKESLAAGYGPDCAEKYGLPWGTK